MPISALVIRLKTEASAAQAAAELSQFAGLVLGQTGPEALAAVLDAPDYRVHDDVLSRLAAHPAVCAIDLVFHDFSDVATFCRPPSKHRKSGD